MCLPTLSIIVPVYNVEKYLRECVDSIIVSTFTDWELLLIDDGTPDKSGVICDEYAQIDNRIKVFHKKNGGVSSARNWGLENAKGNWVTFIDADDIISPMFLEGLMTPVFLNHDLDLVHGGCTNWKDGTTADINQFYKDYVGNEFNLIFEKFRGLAVSKLFRMVNINNWSKSLPLRFDEKMKIAEDMAFTMDYLLTVKKFAFVSEVGYYYRIDNVESATKSKKITPYTIELQSFKHLFNSTLKIVNKKKIPHNSSIYRFSQRGEQLQNVIISLYRNKIDRSERYNHLKYDFTEDELSMLKYVKSNVKKKWIFNLLNISLPLFDILISILYRLKLIN